MTRRFFIALATTLTFGWLVPKMRASVPSKYPGVTDMKMGPWQWPKSTMTSSGDPIRRFRDGTAILTGVLGTDG